MPSRKSSSSMATMELFMLGVLCQAFSAGRKKASVAIMQRFLPGVLCRAFSAEQKKSDGGYNGSFFVAFFMPAEKAGDQNILNAGRKSRLFLCPAFSTGVLMLIVAKVKQKTPSFLCQAFSADELIIAILCIKQKTPSFLCRAFYAELFDCSRGIIENRDEIES